MYIPLNMQCFWCNGNMNRGSCHDGRLSHVTYFCKDCGAVAHFAKNSTQKIDSIEVQYYSKEAPSND